MERVHYYARKRIYVTETLKAFVRNSYKTDEEVLRENELRSAESQLTIIRVALVVTFLGLLASLLVPLFVTSKVELVGGSLPIHTQEAESNAVPESAREREEAEITAAELDVQRNQEAPKIQSENHNAEENESNSRDQNASSP